MNNPELYASSPAYCHYYFDLVASDDLLFELERDMNFTLDLFRSVPLEKEHYAYQPGKWTVTQLLRHSIDCERIFNYRALRFARFDATPLPGFDEDFYMNGLKTRLEKLEVLLEEFILLRKSTISLFRTFSEDNLNFLGTANGLKISARAIGFCVVGHNKHHCKILKERYL